MLCGDCKRLQQNTLTISASGGEYLGHLPCHHQQQIKMCSMGSLERTAGLWLGMRPLHYSFLLKILVISSALAYQIIIKMIALKSNSQANGTVLSSYISSLATGP